MPLNSCSPPQLRPSSEFPCNQSDSDLSFRDHRCSHPLCHPPRKHSPSCRPFHVSPSTTNCCPCCPRGLQHYAGYSDYSNSMFRTIQNLGECQWYKNVNARGIIIGILVTWACTVYSSLAKMLGHRQAVRTFHQQLLLTRTVTLIHYLNMNPRTRMYAGLPAYLLMKSTTCWIVCTASWRTSVSGISKSAFLSERTEA